MPVPVDDRFEMVDICEVVTPAGPADTAGTPTTEAAPIPGKLPPAPLPPPDICDKVSASLPTLGIERYFFS